MTNGPLRDEKGRFVAGGPGGPGRRRKAEQLGGAELAQLAKPVTPAEIAEWINHEQTVEDVVAALAAKSESNAAQMVALHREVRREAELVLLQRLRDERRNGPPAAENANALRRAPAA